MTGLVLTDPLAFVNGAVRVLIWLIGMGIALGYNRKIGALGFFAMAANAGLSAFGVATSDAVPGTVYLVTTVTATPVAAMMVAGYWTLVRRTAQAERLAKVTAERLAARTARGSVAPDVAPRRPQSAA